MKPEQFIREFGLGKAREVVEGHSKAYMPELFKYWSEQLNDYVLAPKYASFLVEDLEKLVESLDRYSKFEDKQEALDAITNAPNGSTHYRKLSCGTRYIKQGPRFFEYWNGSEWCRPTVPFTDETHILRFDKLDDLKKSITDHESIYGGGDDLKG
ncbi:hypothetical protein APC39_15535 [Acinetobacter pittii]|uniref:hypothetical protein n=1 Tax=Acinetobacter pittii TaxID=48296 RepID=UPI0007084764|nr:hypothetical protein [Acinetobacter pittii]KQG36995.1 hypothetical protein APC39_15535 [Acinetobacter pittii]